MALPRTILTSSTAAGRVKHPGPYEYNGNFYFAYWDTTNSRISIRKATGSPDATWSEVTNGGITLSVNPDFVVCGKNGADLHFIVQRDTTDTNSLQYDWVSYDMSTESFGTSEVVRTSPVYTGVSHIDFQSGGNVVVCLASGNVKIMGTDYQRKSLFIRTGTNTWNQVDWPNSGSDTFGYMGMSFVVDTNTDKIHCVMYNSIGVQNGCTFASSSPWGNSSIVTGSNLNPSWTYGVPGFTPTTTRAHVRIIDNISGFYVNDDIWTLSGGDINTWVGRDITTEKTTALGAQGVYGGVYYVNYYDSTNSEIVIEKHESPNYYFAPVQNPADTTNIGSAYSGGGVMNNGTDIVMGYVYLNTSSDILYDEYVIANLTPPEANATGYATVVATGSGGQVLPRVDANATATMTANAAAVYHSYATVATGTDAWAMGDNMPFVSWHNYIYLFVVTTGDVIHLYKSNKPGDISSGFTSVLNISCGDPAWSIHYDIVQNVVYIAIQNGSTGGSYSQGDVVFAEIMLDSDSYITSPTVIVSPATPSTTYRIPSLVVHPWVDGGGIDLGGGHVVICYQGSKDNVSGTNYERIDMAYRKRDHTWVTNQQVDPGGSDHWMDVKAFPSPWGGGGSTRLRYNIVATFRSTTATNAYGGTAIYVSTMKYDYTTETYTRLTARASQHINDLGNATNSWTLALVDTEGADSVGSYLQNYDGKGNYYKDSTTEEWYWFNFSSSDSFSHPIRGSSTQGARWQIIPDIMEDRLYVWRGYQKWNHIALQDNATTHVKLYTWQFDDNKTYYEPPDMPDLGGVYTSFGVFHWHDQKNLGRHSYLIGFTYGSSTYIYEAPGALTEWNDDLLDDVSVGINTGVYELDVDGTQWQYSNDGPTMTAMPTVTTSGAVSQSGVANMLGRASMSASPEGVVASERFVEGIHESLDGFSGTDSGITWTRVNPNGSDIAKVKDRFISPRPGT